MANKIKIFLIDDDRFVLKATSKKFHDYDVEIRTFDNPEEALLAMADEKPQLVFLDYNMPGLTGEEVIVKVSEFKLFNEVALYLLSGSHFDDNEVVKLRTLGFYNVYKKPLLRESIHEIFQMHFGKIPYKAA